MKSPKNLIILSLLSGVAFNSQAAQIEVPSQYATIQAAIAAADAGDTIVVAPGNYLEQLTIPKSITLVGPATDPAAERDGSNEATIKSVLVNVGVSGVSISGFTFDDGSLVLGEKNAITLNNNASNVTIDNNRFIGNYVGTNETKVVGITTSSSGASNITVTSNYFKGYETALYVNPAASTVVFSGNTVENTRYGTRFISTDGITLTDNHYINSGGVHFRKGWSIPYANNTIDAFSGNSFSQFDPSLAWVGFFGIYDDSLDLDLSETLFEGKLPSEMDLQEYSALRLTVYDTTNRQPASGTTVQGGFGTAYFGQGSIIDRIDAPIDTNIWIQDRYSPAYFGNDVFNGENVLRLTISEADSQNNRPSNYRTTFYNTQGRKIFLADAYSFTADVYIPEEWATVPAYAGVWTSAWDGLTIVSYPIITFTSAVMSSDNLTVTEVLPRFRFWDSSVPSGEWRTDLEQVVSDNPPFWNGYNQWYTIRIDIDPYAEVAIYSINGHVIGTVPAPGVGFIKEGFLHGWNFGSPITYNSDPIDGYDIFFDNVGIAEDMLTVTATATTGGSISSEGVNYVLPGGSISFEITAEDGALLQDVLVNGNSVGPVTTYTFTELYESATIEAIFLTSTKTVTINTSGNGTASPSGTIVVATGGSQIITFTAASGWSINLPALAASVPAPTTASVAGNSIILGNISDDITLNATFTQSSYTVTASAANTLGTISPTGTQLVSAGNSVTYKATPKMGTMRARILVNGVPVVTGLPGKVVSYTLTPESDATVVAQFAASF